MIHHLPSPYIPQGEKVKTGGQAVQCLAPAPADGTPDDAARGKKPKPEGGPEQGMSHVCALTGIAQSNYSLPDSVCTCALGHRASVHPLDASPRCRVPGVSSGSKTYTAPGHKMRFPASPSPSGRGSGWGGKSAVCGRARY